MANPEPPAAKSSIFGGSKASGVSTGQIAQLAQDVNATSARLRILEGRYENLRKKLQVIERNMISENKRLLTEVKASSLEVKDLDKNLADMKEKMKLMIKELKLTAKSDEFTVLKRYIQLWEPLNFVTRNELGKILKEMVQDEMEDLSIKMQEEGFIEDQIRVILKQVLGEKGKNKSSA